TRLQGDWSSDVCSSDLRPDARVDGEFVRALASRRRFAALLNAEPRFPVTPPAPAPQKELGEGDQSPPDHCQLASQLNACPHAKKIGRASCRERVNVPVV